MDPEIGTSYNYYRDYDPALGRYVQSDPIGLNGGISTYGYAGQNSIIYIDPLGLGYYPPWLTFNGDIQALDAHPSSVPQVVVSDLPNGDISVIRNAFPDGSHDADFFMINDTWYKIKAGTALISSDSCSPPQVKSHSLFFDGLLGGFVTPSIYEVDNPSDFWGNRDGNTPQEHLESLHRKGMLTDEEIGNLNR